MLHRTFLVACGVLFVMLIAGLCVSTPTDDLRTITKSPQMLQLFIHNAYGAIFLMSGLLTFGISSLGLLSFNGFIFGNVIGVHGLTVGWGSALLAVIPHGILEIPGILCAAAVGFHGTLMVFHALRGTFLGWRVYFHSISRYALLSFVFLFIASIIETFVTPIFL